MKTNNKIWKRTKTKKLSTVRLCNKTSTVYISVGLFIIVLCTNHTLKAQTNTAYGTDALKSVTTGITNSAFGFNSLYLNTTGSGNTASGNQALFSNFTGWGNTASGNQALYSNVAGWGNTASGAAALYSNISYGNTADGNQALFSNTTGSENMASGYFALSSNTTGYHNTANGSGSLQRNTTGSYNTASGRYALSSNTTGSGNTASGNEVLSSNTTGYHNTANGGNALAANTTGSNNTALGYNADVTKGDLTNATALGANAKVSESNAIQLGDNAVTKVYAGVGKTATVITGGLQVTGGSPAVGQVLTSDASGTATWQAPNTGTDWHLFGNYDANETSFIGPQNLVSFNIKIKDNIAGKLDPTYFNTFYGYLAGQKTQPYYSNGTNNTAVGYSSLATNTYGTQNTTLGYKADVGTENLTNATAIGANAKVSESNAIQLGDNVVTKVYAGVGKTATVITGGLQVTGGTPAVGKVLTSDASGTATWQTPSNDWTLRGNAGTTDSNFIGTTDNKPLNIRINNQKAGRIDSASQNTFYGYKSGNANTTGSNNTVVGYKALSANTTGQSNTAIGSGADVTKGDLTNATAIGANAKVTTSNVVQLGDNAVTKVYAGVGNAATVIAGGLQVTGGTPAVGKVLTSDASGVASWQTPIPSWSLTGNTGTVDGTNFIGTIDNIPFNIRVNNQKAARIDHLKSNTFYGYQSGNANTTGNNNTVVGHKAFSTNTTGQWNTAVGSETLLSNTTGYFNSASGYQALYSNTTGFNNSAHGYVALYKNTSGTGNTASGFSALASNTTGANNTALGQSADVGAGNLNNATAIGAKAKVSESNAIQLGDNAVTKVYAGVGTAATLIAGGLQVTGGTPAAGKILTSDANGVASWQTLNTNSWGLAGNAGTIDGTHFIGTTDNVPFNIKVNNEKAGRIDANNAFYGYQAGNAHTTGGFNTAHGYQALYANTTGDGNTAIGREAMKKNDAGNNNTAIGSLALSNNVSGNFNTALGYNADVSAPNLSNATAIGNAAIVNASNKIRLGDVTAKTVEIEMGGAYVVSDGRFKTNIKEEVKGLEFIKKLRPVVYNVDVKKRQEFLTQNMPADARQKYMNKDFSASTAIRQSGFIAQEVEKAAQEVGYDFNGLHKPESANDNYSLAYSQFVVPLVKGMQEQEQKIEAQEKQNEQQQQIIQQLQQQIDELKKLVIGNVSVTKDLATKQIETAGSEDIALYPNPTTGICTITTSNIDNGVIEIYDMAGNSLQKTTFNNAKSGYQLNVSGYTKGIYLLNIVANNKKYTKRLVIQ